MRYLYFAFFVLTSSLAYASSDLFLAAGRVELVPGPGSCSAALISEDIIITAAHCVREGAETKYMFRPGTGDDPEPIPIAHILAHPLYEELPQQGARRLRFDLAVGRLEMPVTIPQPFALGEDAKIGEGLFLASWRGNQGPRPRQRRCVVIEGNVPGVVTLGCRVRGGESGAPVLRLTENGLELVAIVNSTARQGTQTVALASNVISRIPVLLERLSSTP